MRQDVILCNMEIVRTDYTEPRFVQMCHVLDESQRQVLPEWDSLGKSSVTKLDILSDVVLILDNGMPVAAAGLDTTSDTLPCVRRVIVCPRYRGQGLGQMVCGEIEKIAVEKGFDTMRLYVGSYLNAARKLYKKMGYSQVGEKTSPTGHVDIIMEKKLLTPRNF